MANTNKAVAAPDVSKTVFEEFLSAIEAKKVDAAIVTRLRKQLLKEKVFTEKALRESIFPLEDQL